MSELVEQLRSMQREEGLSDAAFAGRLGVHRVMWSLVRRGKRQPGKRLIEGAFRLRQDLGDLYARSLQITTPSDPNMQHRGGAA